MTSQVSHWEDSKVCKNFLRVRILKHRDRLSYVYTECTFRMGQKVTYAINNSKLRHQQKGPYDFAESVFFCF